MAAEKQLKRLQQEVTEHQRQLKIKHEKHAAIMAQIIKECGL